MKHDIRASEEKKPVASFISSQFFYCQHAIYNVVSVVSIHTHPLPPHTINICMHTKQGREKYSTALSATYSKCLKGFSDEKLVKKFSKKTINTPVEKNKTCLEHLSSELDINIY